MLSILRIKGSLRRFWQRLTRGWDESDWWELDESFIKWVTPRLKEFRLHLKGYPSSVYEECGGFKDLRFAVDDDTDKLAMLKWKSILDEMIVGFSINLSYNETGKSSYTADERQIKLKNSLNLFVKYFDSLWD